MKMILFLSLLSTLLLAKNPHAYSVLGDQIFDNVDDIVKLRKIVHYKKDKAKINSYYFDVHGLKYMGFKLDANDKSIDKKEYLSKLRTLVIINDYYLRTMNDDFKASIKNEDSKLFSDMINTGIIDTQRYKKDILRYYQTHKDSINPRGILKRIIDKYNRLKAKKKYRKPAISKFKRLQMEKMKRVIAKDKADQILLEKRLEDELIKKKLRIQKEYNRSL